MGLIPHAAARRVGKAAIDFLLPPRCMRCGGGVATAGTVCAQCWGSLSFLGPPWCAVCGLPFEHDPGAEGICGACARVPPAFDRCRSALRYDDESRGLVLAFKHGDRTQSAPLFGRWMALAAREFAGADLVVPVPLHWTRLLMRRFNQSALLAQRLGREMGVAVLPDALVRRRRTRSQGHLTPRQRSDNVRGAFRVHPRRAARVAGRRILLVDDVLTTGATVEACAWALRRAGARSVDVVTLARVVRPSR